MSQVQNLTIIIFYQFQELIAQYIESYIYLFICLR